MVSLMLFLVNSIENALKSPPFRLFVLMAALVLIALFMTDGEPFVSTEVVVWAWAAELYHLAIWSARLLCPGAAAAFMLSLALQKRGKKDE